MSINFTDLGEVVEDDIFKYETLFAISIRFSMGIEVVILFSTVFALIGRIAAYQT